MIGRFVRNFSTWLDIKILFLYRNPYIDSSLETLTSYGMVQYKDGSWPKSNARIVWVCVFGLGIPARFYGLGVIQYKFHHNWAKAVLITNLGNNSSES